MATTGILCWSFTLAERMDLDKEIVSMDLDREVYLSDEDMERVIRILKQEWYKNKDVENVVSEAIDCLLTGEMSNPEWKE